VTKPAGIIPLTFSTGLIKFGWIRFPFWCRENPVLQWLYEAAQ